MLDGLTPGQQLLRREVHELYGGRQQGGIGPSRVAPVVLFFTDPATGQQHGYYDGWDEDGLYNYVGEGQRGDQRLVQGNRAILDHVADGRTLEGFLAAGTTVTYLGEFELVDHHFTEAHESGSSDVLRQVVVFRMRPKNFPDTVALPKVPATRDDGHHHVEAVPIEGRHTERAFVSPDQLPHEAERREAELVHRYHDHLIRQGHEVQRLRILPAGETSPLYSDLWDATTEELIEAKSGATRNEVRMAVGQLLDYARFARPKSLAVLVPSEPRPDIVAYLASLNVRAVYPDTSSGTWVRTPLAEVRD